MLFGKAVEFLEVGTSLAEVVHQRWDLRLFFLPRFLFTCYFLYVDAM